MIIKYFDEWEEKQALSYITSNPLVSKLKFEEYLNKYPKDYSARIYYTTVLTILGEFDEAENVLDDVEFAINTDRKFASEIDRIKQNKLDIIIARLRILAHQERYEELYQIYLTHLEEIENTNIDIKPLIFYCKKKIGMINGEKREEYPYIFRQIISYDENDFYKHIKKHFQGYRRNVSEENKGIFRTRISFETLVNEVKKYIPSAIRLYPHLYTDVYIFKYNECGTYNNETVNYFKVICFHNTADIITMYPEINCENLPHIDLNYLIKNDTIQSKGPVKRLSQIDKFNKRYGIK